MCDTDKNVPKWREYEKITAQIYKTLSSQAIVTHNDKIYGHDSKKERQIDISIRQNIGPHTMLIIVQCKDYKDKIDVNDVGELIAVVKDVRANMGVMVSNSGFTDGAINLAKENGIQLCSLYDAQSSNWRNMVKIPILCVVVRPIQIRGKFQSSAFTIKPYPADGDVNRMEFVKQNGESKSFVELFTQEWNSRRINSEPGEHIHQFSEKDLQIRAADGSLVPVVVNFIVKITKEFRFGYLGISDSQGIVNIVDGSYTTKEITTDAMDVVEACNKWKLLSSDSDVPQSPLITINAYTMLSPEMQL